MSFESEFVFQLSCINRNFIPAFSIKKNSPFSPQLENVFDFRADKGKYL